MSETKFFQTRMGQRFYEGTAPDLVKKLTRLNELLERLVAAQERQLRNPDDANA